MAITTIKLEVSTKRALEPYRKGQSYNEAIKRLVAIAQQDSAEELVAEQYRANNKEALRIHKEWEGANAPWPEY